MMLARMVSCARVVVVEYPGAIYHVMDRGDRQDFLKILAESCQETAWQVHACCLRNETTLPVKWIAARVQFGTAKETKFLSAKVKSGCSEGESPSSLGRTAPEFRTKELDGKV